MQLQKPLPIAQTPEEILLIYLPWRGRAVHRGRSLGANRGFKVIKRVRVGISVARANSVGRFTDKWP